MMVHRILCNHCGTGWAVLLGLTLLVTTSCCSLHTEKRGMIVRGDWALEFNRTPYIGCPSDSGCDPKDENCGHKKKGLCSLLSRDPDTKSTSSSSKTSVSNPSQSSAGVGAVFSPLPTGSESDSTTNPPSFMLRPITPSSQFPTSPSTSLSTPSTSVPVRLVPNLQTGQMVAVPVCIHQPTCATVMVPSLGQSVPMCGLQPNRSSQPAISPQPMLLVQQSGGGVSQVPLSHNEAAKNDTVKTAISGPTLHAVPTKPVFQPIAVQR